jgi:predicted nucleic acid-binding Zn ribbon protein
LSHPRERCVRMPAALAREQANLNLPPTFKSRSSVMGKTPTCQFCGEQIDVGEEFVFLVEAQEFEERFGPLVLAQSSAAYHGEPMRICKACRRSIKQNQRDIERREQASTQRTRQRMWIVLIAGMAALLFILFFVIAGR